MGIHGISSQELASSPYSCTLVLSMVHAKVLCIVGPTSSGKTALSLHLASRFFGEVINGDARQLYRDAPIGTGRPDWQMMGKIPHHLFGMSDPEERWTVSHWCEEVMHALRQIQGREHLPMIVGGTGLYIRALTEGFVFEGEPDPRVRAQLLAYTATERLEQLLRLVPTAGEWVDLKNPHRVLRALERALSGQSITAVRVPPPLSVCKIARYIAPDVLRTRIEQAIDQQLARGWAEEVRALVERGVSLDSPLMQSIGFRAIAYAIKQGAISDRELREEILADTWAYARRQMTWFRKEPGLQWVHTEAEAEERVQAWLGA